MSQPPPFIPNDLHEEPEIPRAETLRAAISDEVPEAVTSDETAEVPPLKIPWWETTRYRNISGVFLSVVFHVTILVLLALMFEVKRPGLFTGVESSPIDNTPLKTTTRDESLSTPSLRDTMVGEVVFVAPEMVVPDVGEVEETPAAAATPINPIGVHTSDLNQRTDRGTQRMYEGRGKAARAMLAQARGGSNASEAAVERGLRWLASQQHDDGSWSFNIPSDPDRPVYSNPGTEASRTAATAIAILPFLGAGYTHLGGEYQETIHRGLYYLMSQVKQGPEGADLRSGSQNAQMYAQGLATIVFCEVAAMTGDAIYKPLAQDAINFISYAQDKKGGGWRYTPGVPGDTTVTGWQLMALKSSQASKLDVPSMTLHLATQFLDSVATDDGAQYGYMTPSPKNSTTAIGLLCRMYSGWPRSRPALKKGVGLLSRWGPSPTDLYYDYYATQVLNHWGGAEWKKWNAKLRDHLVQTQSQQGVESGSWYFPDPNGDKGGRLYNTAMSIMILEVYYRHMPLYGSDPL